MKKLSIIPIVLAAIFWGALGIFTTIFKDAGFETMQVVCTRTSLATLALAAINFAANGRTGFKIRLFPDLAVLFICGTLTLTVNNYFYFQSISRIGMSAAAVLMYTAPVFVLIMSAALFREKVTTKKVISVILTVIGCTLVSLSTEGHKTDGLGILFGVLSGFTYATYSIFTKNYLKKYSPWTVVMYVYMSAAISSYFVANPFETFTAIIDKNLIIPAIIMGAVCGGAAHGLYTLGMKYTEPSVASVVASLELVAATVFGLVIYNQKIMWYQTAGIIVVLLAITISNVTFRRNSKNPQENS